MQPSVENVPRSADESLSVMAYRQDAFPFVWHLHPEWELTLIVDGAGQRYVGDSVEEFSPGDLVLLPGNLPHTWHGQGTKANGCASVVVFFIEQAVGDLPELANVRRLMDRASCGLAFSGRGAHAIADRLYALDDLHGVERLTLFWSILDQLSRVRSVRRLSSQPFDRPFAPADQQDIDRVCRWVVERLDREIRQSDAAALIHRSPSAFAGSSVTPHSSPRVSASEPMRNEPSICMPARPALKAACGSSMKPNAVIGSSPSAMPT